MPRRPWVLLIAALLFGLGAPVAGRSPEVPTTVVLVRHAEKGAEPATDPHLSPAGLVRASMLGSMLAHARVASVYATPFARSQETAAAIASATGAAPKTYDPSDFRACAARILRDEKSRVVVVVGHTNTIPQLIAALGGPAVDPIAETDFDTVFVLTIPGKGGSPSILRLAVHP